MNPTISDEALAKIIQSESNLSEQQNSDLEILVSEIRGKILNRVSTMSSVQIQEFKKDSLIEELDNYIKYKLPETRLDIIHANSVMIAATVDEHVQNQILHSQRKTRAASSLETVANYLLTPLKMLLTQDKDDDDELNGLEPGPSIEEPLPKETHEPTAIPNVKNGIQGAQRQILENEVAQSNSAKNALNPEARSFESQFSSMSVLANKSDVDKNTSVENAGNKKSLKNLQKTKVSHSNCLPGCKKKSDGIQTIRCCTCMRWYHAACVKEDPKTSGIWNCYECRDLPHRINEFLSEFEAIIGNSNAMFQVNIELNTIKLKM